MQVKNQFKTIRNIHIGVGKNTANNRVTASWQAGSASSYSSGANTPQFSK